MTDSAIVPLLAANDNRPALSAKFIDVPAVFLQVYSREILSWSGEVTKRQTLEITPWNFPRATILSPGWQAPITLRCDVAVATQTGAVLMIIRPDGEENLERLRKHVEALPAIMRAQESRAQAERGTGRRAVKAVFDLPEYFVQRYGYELREWGRNLARIGTVKTIALREGTLSDLSPDEELGAVMLGVKLEAKIERLQGDEMRLVISPLTEQDERAVREHCQKMQAAGISALAWLVEPPRPGIPTMPTIMGAPPPPEDGGV